MANNSYTQQALSADPNFHLRVRGCLATVAWKVLKEDPGAFPDHAARASYARSVIQNIPIAAQGIAPWLVERPNLALFETSYSFVIGAVVTAAGDPDIEAQLEADWSTLAGMSGPITP